MKRWLAIALGALLLAAAACGNDSDSTRPASESSRDQAFVTGLCRSFSVFTDDVDKALAGPTPTDLGQAFEMVFTALVGPIQRFSQSFAKLQPPDDLAAWHKDTSRQLAAAAKALKAGKFDDPSLDSLAASPVPDMPVGPRDRLAAIAAKTSECEQVSPFDADSGLGNGSGGNSKAPSQALKDAAVGTWSGKFGTLDFNPDGSAVFDIKSCGTDTSSRAPFQMPDTCSAQRFSGTLEVEPHGYVLRQKSGVGSVFGAYVDKSGRLHVGLGDVSAFGPGQKGTIDLFAQPDVEVDGSKCTQSRKAVTCSWTKEQGEDVLEINTGAGGGVTKVVILPAEGLAVEPSTYVSVFDKK